MKQFWITNLVLFQACWLCAAFLPSAIAGPLMVTLCAIHFWLSPTRREDAIILALVPLGLVADAIQLSLGVFEAGNTFFPFWLLMMWVMFTISLNHSLKWLSHCPPVALILIGAIGGTASYWGGIKAGVIEPLLATHMVILSLALVWAIVIPTFVRLRRQLMLSAQQPNPPSKPHSKIG
ncbi:DUF2878 domain-containing protein [Vibrio amylolyticus]|uniref:DUF2878 domain-containing protein n=1 Tax=Vibrio amylolyticus TaxID=2847292 RepID=UPI00354ECE3B